jgi:hypothetical protein
LGMAITPLSAPGPPASGAAVWSGCCAGCWVGCCCGFWLGSGVWLHARRRGVSAKTAIPRSGRQLRNKWVADGDWRVFVMTTSVLRSIVVRAARCQLRASYRAAPDGSATVLYRRGNRRYGNSGTGWQRTPCGGLRVGRDHPDSVRGSGSGVGAGPGSKEQRLDKRRRCSKGC